MEGPRVPTYPANVEESPRVVPALVAADLNPRLEIPALRLARTSEERYCRAALASSRNEFWWYFNGLAPFGGYSKPFFDDRTGRWWYRVKPGFAWPVSFFRPIVDAPERAPHWALLGWQWPILHDLADSCVRMNTIWRLENYALNTVAPAKRRAVARGLRELEITAESPADVCVIDEALDVWNEHVARTGWNRPMGPGEFAASFAELDRWPGTTLITARDPRHDRALCAWMIVRCIDDTLYIDTVASHTQRLQNRPNDSMIFAALVAARQRGLSHAHYSMVSGIPTLEAFKRSLGFVPHEFPTRLRLRAPVAAALQRWRPDIYQRLHGDPGWTNADTPQKKIPWRWPTSATTTAAVTASVETDAITQLISAVL